MQNNNLNIDDILNDFELELELKIQNIDNDNSYIEKKLFEKIDNNHNNNDNNEDILENNNINSSIINNKETLLEKKLCIPWKKHPLNIIHKIIFLFKYLVTTSLIFWILLLTTNYNAYFNIINSYIYKEELENKSKWLITSVKASEIKENNKNKTKQTKNKENIENEKENVISKYSIKRLVNSSDNEKLSMDIKIWKNIPLIDIKNRKISWEKELNNIFMKELENWVVRYPSSAKPWEIWNTFIFWHSSNFPWIKWNFNAIFSLIDKVVYDDEIIIYYNQKKIRYKIKEKKVISPWDVSILKRDNNKAELTLMTCRPIGTTLNRLIITWEIIE